MNQLTALVSLFPLRAHLRSCLLKFEHKGGISPLRLSVSLKMLISHFEIDGWGDFLVKADLLSLFFRRPERI